MPKAVRIAVSVRTPDAASGKSGRSQLITIALFAGIGLLASLVAIIMGLSAVGY
jgi:hypothetical protein